MRRKAQDPPKPPPLEEVDVDEIDQVNGGFIEMLMGALGMGNMFGFGNSSNGGFPAMPGGFPTAGQSPSGVQQLAQIMDLMDLRSRRRGPGNGKNRG
jgi:hypothetical protein